MELKKMSGGTSVDTDELTADPGKVVEGTSFLGHGSEEPQNGSLPDMEKARSSPTFDNEGQHVPIHKGTTSRAVTDSTGAKRVVISPPLGRFPGDNLAFVGCSPEDLGITASKIPTGISICQVQGSWGSDSDFSADDLKDGKVAYGKNGRVIGSKTDYGAVSKTIAAGEKYEIKKGCYDAGAVTAKDLKSQTGANLADDMAREGYTFWKDGTKHTGTLKYRGTAQYGGFGAGTDYYAINGLPEGIYRNEGAGTWAPEARIKKDTLRSGIGLTAAKISKGQVIADVTGTAPRSANVNYMAYDGNINYTGYSNTAGNRSISLGTPYGDWDTVVLQIKAVTEYCGPVTVSLSKGHDMRVPVTVTKWSDSQYVVAWLSISRSNSGEIKIAPFRGNTSGTYRTQVQIMAVLDGIINNES